MYKSIRQQYQFDIDGSKDIKELSILDGSLNIIQASMH